MRKQESLFESLPTQKTGVDFINTLIETEEFNIIEYLYFYNGGGIAVGDVNNDGLIDIYFSANQGPNKLFLNKGDMVFEDITLSAGLASEKPWKTGVSMADINGDGLLDIYVCRLGDWKGIVGENELYINNGNLTFTESAAEYGLDFQGFSTQAAFFDYDRDGDLDMYLLNHAVHTAKSFGRSYLRNFDDGLAGDRLYRNNLDKGEKKFTGVTNEANIFSSQIGYGLGIGITDINNDGWPDIYVSNDFNENDYLYINQADGTFNEQISSRVNYSSRFSMGSDFADFNNDGWIDFITLDMLPRDEVIQKRSAGEDSEEIYKLKLSFGFERQVSRNSLQLNNANGTFSELGQLSGIYATDWSWAALMADFDNDGWKDVFVSNGIVRRPNDLDYINFITNPDLEEGLQNKPDISDLDLSKEMPPGDVTNFFFKNNGDFTFQDVSYEWGIVEKSISNGAVYADLDNDGDLDLLVNNINKPAGIFENKLEQFPKSERSNYLKVRLKGLMKNKFGIGARVEIYSNSQILVQENYTSRGFQSSTAPEIHFGLGEISLLDSLKIIWPAGKSETLRNLQVNKTLTLEESNATIIHSYISPAKTSLLKTIDNEITGLDFQHLENDYNDFNLEPLLPHKLSREGPSIATGDFNGDGRQDIYVGGATGQAGALFIQSKEGKFHIQSQPLIEADSALEDVSAIFFDSNQDGFIDLLVGRGGNNPENENPEGQTKIYLSNGKGEFFKSINLPLEKNTQVSVVRAFDFDEDGLEDLMIGGRNEAGKYGEIPRSYLLKNLGENRYEDVTKEIAPDLEYVGMVKDAEWKDLDLDGKTDLIVVGEWMPVTIFLNKNGKLSNETLAFGLEKSSGWWNSLASGDFNGDGYPDLLLGNLGLNSRLKASKEFPVKMMVKDFDQNGKVEQIISYPLDGKNYTVATKDELTKQIPSLKKDFVYYSDFSGKTVEEVFRSFDVKDAKVLEAYQFESLILYNQAGKGFLSKSLPIEAQFAPIEAITIEDLDQDGYFDVVLGGNNTSSAPYFGAYQGSWGLILRGDSNGFFKVDKEQRLKIKGDIKAIEKVTVGFRKWLVFAKNDGELEVLEIMDLPPSK
ncbi:VCBS repeat-containing protein [Algoriphagus sp.]|uniref:VCBS repeat-containing protein n=1 Tax=Algoriphagus sp. TaxID=1872435 RepID=UPI0025E9CCE1|nr:VCBS repeat-containing protein [Algoriphagus sp.]